MAPKANLRQRLTRVLMALVLLCLVVVPWAGAEGDRFERITASIEQSMDRNGVPGVSIAMIEDYQVVWAQGFGIAEPGRDITASTLFQAASLSKPVSAVAAAAAAEEGLIDLEADALAMTTSWRHPTPWWEGPITLRMLFSHRAGVNARGFPGYRMDEWLPELPRMMDGILDKNEPIRVMTEPGVHKYSSGGFQIAQLAIEDHTGIEFEELAQTLVFDPLGMEASTYRLLREESRDLVAVGHRADGSEVAGGGWHLYPETAAGSLWSTPTDYAVFLIDVMQSYETGAGTVLDQTTARLLLDPDFAVGFGISREEVGIALGHEGATEGFRTQFVALPQLGDGVVLFTNGDTGLELTSEIIDVVGGELDWPWLGWSTPLWAFLLMLAGLIALLATGFVMYRNRRALLESAA